MKKTPDQCFTLIIILTLALGIGANTAICSFINAILLNPLPYREPERLVRIHSLRGEESGRISMMEIEDIKQLNCFESIAAFIPVAQYNASGDGNPEEIPAILITYNLFEVLGVPLLQGQLWPVEVAQPNMYILMCTSVAPLTLVEVATKKVWALDAEPSIFDIYTMEQRLADHVWHKRLSYYLFGLFALLALLLAALGVYGVVSYSVSQRTSEIDIRIALGAQSRDVILMVLSDVIKIVMAGCGMGLLASFALTGLIANLLYSISPGDPITLISVPLLLIIVALTAGYIPARKAASTPPNIALRYE
ncbi:MAG: FtsX-like permease family protein [Acidobacteriota bacterium]